MKTMTPHSVAHSMSRPIKQLFSGGEFAAQVLGVFERSCNLVTPEGEVVALVVPQIGDGPLNIVVDDNPVFFSKIEPGTAVALTESQFEINRCRVDLSNVAVWEPQPDWEVLRARQAKIASRLPFLRNATHYHAPDNTFLTLLKAPHPNEGVTLSTARSAGESLREGWTRDQERLRAVGEKLAGLGNGLTPAGDDFLSGIMLWAWLTHPDPVPFCQTLLQAAARRTTTLSAAFLRAAAEGECARPWHVLLIALSTGAESDIQPAVQKVLAHGATSGADTLAGFLYLT